MPIKKTFPYVREDISIDYMGGELRLHFKEYSQPLHLRKDWQSYGEDRVVVSSSAWGGEEKPAPIHNSEATRKAETSDAVVCLEKKNISLLRLMIGLY